MFVGAMILVSPLGEIVGGRAISSHSIEARGDIYSDVLERIPESPILGFGAPLANPDPNRPAIGTHGMLWTSLFSQGVPGAIFYVGFWVAMTLRTGRNVRNQEHLLLHLAVASSLPTLLFYDHIPAALPIMMICTAVILRDRRVSDARREAAVTRHAVLS
jgi:O-antigen ligase